MLLHECQFDDNRDTCGYNGISSQDILPGNTEITNSFDWYSSGNEGYLYMYGYEDLVGTLVGYVQSGNMCDMLNINNTSTRCFSLNPDTHDKGSGQNFPAWCKAFM